MKTAIGREITFLPDPYNGLRLSFGYNAGGDKVVTLSGLGDHITRDHPADRRLVERLAGELGEETLLEIEIDSEAVFDHVLAVYPDYWRFVADRSVTEAAASPLEVAQLADYFPERSHPNRLLGCYFDTAQLWADKASRNVLAALLKETNLYFCSPLGPIANPAPGYRDLTGFDEEYCW